MLSWSGKARGNGDRLESGPHTEAGKESDDEHQDAADTFLAAWPEPQEAAANFFPDDISVSHNGLLSYQFNWFFMPFH